MSTSIRAANIQDAPAIATVHITTWRETYRGFLPDDLLNNLKLDERATLWHRIISANADHPTSGQVVADSSGIIVGFGSCGKGRSQRCLDAGYLGEISTLYLLMSHQGCGHGTALFRYLIDHLVIAGIGSASLWVLDKNVRARNFYERFGAVAFAERTDDHRGSVTTEIAYGWDDLARLQSDHFSET